MAALCHVADRGISGRIRDIKPQRPFRGGPDVQYDQHGVKSGGRKLWGPGYPSGSAGSVRVGDCGHGADSALHQMGFKKRESGAGRGGRDDPGFSAPGDGQHAGALPAVFRAVGAVVYVSGVPGLRQRDRLFHQQSAPVRHRSGGVLLRPRGEDAGKDQILRRNADGVSPGGCGLLALL